MASQSDHLSVLVVVSRFNEGVTRKLLKGAVESCERAGVPAEKITTVWVPGAFELPLALLSGLETGKFDLAVALGAVIRGDTPHFDFVSAEATRGIGEVALRTGRPVGFGLLTCDNQEQALARAGGGAGNKGTEAAETALAMVAVLKEFDAGR